MNKKRADKCTTHHLACDCREYKFEQAESTLKIIQTWAKFWTEEQEYESPRKLLNDIANAAHKALHCLDED